MGEVRNRAVGHRLGIGAAATPGAPADRRGHGGNARSLFRRLNEEDGAITIIVAVAMVALLGISAYTLDTGRWRRDTIRLQSATDAGALAGARLLPATS